MPFSRLFSFIYHSYIEISYYIPKLRSVQLIRRCIEAYTMRVIWKILLNKAKIFSILLTINVTFTRDSMLIYMKYRGIFVFFFFGLFKCDFYAVLLVIWRCFFYGQSDCNIGCKKLYFSIKKKTNNKTYFSIISSWYQSIRSTTRFFGSNHLHIRSKTTVFWLIVFFFQLTYLFIPKSFALK